MAAIQVGLQLFPSRVLKADALCCLQNFLSVNGIKFYESKMNLNWKPIIKSIQEVCIPFEPLTMC